MQLVGRRSHSFQQVSPLVSASPPDLINTCEPSCRTGANRDAKSGNPTGSEGKERRNVSVRCLDPASGDSCAELIARCGLPQLQEVVPLDLSI
ncbi:hypothetical protein FTUN_8834 [Frigoriglobus tundricola]|uniref:Uncharacterized protein n=1 Tax=Frigoriglobus tundricola TaxID=2774151 RepID=A0A6M5Z678_9BACT|nr:hypothetical protein FTUN_8834 [Frigoriglobus tundricola]